jgi:hypothetical protein
MEGRDLPAEPTDPDQVAVLAILRRDEQAHTRAELVRLTGLADRRTRVAIQALRLTGWPICSASSHAGYRLAWSAEEILLLELDLRARALTALRVRSALRGVRSRLAA